MNFQYLWNKRLKKVIQIKLSNIKYTYCIIAEFYYNITLIFTFLGPCKAKQNQLVLCENYCQWDEESLGLVKFQGSKGHPERGCYRINLASEIYRSHIFINEKLLIRNYMFVERHDLSLKQTFLKLVCEKGVAINWTKLNCL